MSDRPEKTDRGEERPETMDVESLGREIIRMAEYLRTHEREYRDRLDEYERLRRDLGDAAPPRRHFREPDDDFL